MGERLRLRLTYANVIATLSLFLALGGGAAYAATHLSRNSVGTKQLKKDAVTSAKIKDGSLLAADFKSGQLPAGERGPQGAPGAPGATSAVVRYGEEGKPKEGEGGESYASCRAGEAVTGGRFAGPPCAGGRRPRQWLGRDDAERHRRHHLLPRLRGLRAALTRISIDRFI